MAKNGGTNASGVQLVTQLAVSTLASKLLATVAKMSAQPESIGGIAARWTRRIILLFADPPCRVNVTGISSPLMLPLSHEMPIYRATYPNYDLLPARLAKLLRGQNGQLRMIDVGANVGDTILSTEPNSMDKIMALEPHPTFFPYLVHNVSGFASIECVQMACSDQAQHLFFDVQRRGTSASVPNSSKPLRVEAKMLDDIWQEKWLGERVDFLKIDTDGFDASVLRGAQRLLSKWHPWLYFEFDARLTPGGANELLDALSQLRDCGYMEALVFRNQGTLVGRVNLSDISYWEGLLLAPSTDKTVHYHDVLALPPEVHLMANRLCDRLVQTSV